jgi:hypothetical protein
MVVGRLGVGAEVQQPAKSGDYADAGGQGQGADEGYPSDFPYAGK